MATTYRFQVSMPVSDTLARNRIANVLHFEHVTGGIDDDALNSMCEDLVELYQKRYHNTTKEIQCKAYDVGPIPNYPRADVVVNGGVVWTCSVPREVALVLSYSADHRGNKSERGRIYTMPQIDTTIAATGLRPAPELLTWALDFYTVPNESFPDIGGVDWKFGVYSKTYNKFTQSTQAWVNDDWDTQRRRGLRETTRATVTREG